MHACMHNPCLQQMDDQPAGSLEPCSNEGPVDQTSGEVIDNHIAHGLVQALCILHIICTMTVIAVSRLPKQP